VIDRFLASLTPRLTESGTIGRAWRIVTGRFCFLAARIQVRSAIGMTTDRRFGLQGDTYTGPVGSEEFSYYKNTRFVRQGVRGMRPQTIVV